MARTHGATSAERQWPAEVVLLRHGESAGNVARDRALAEGLPVIDIATRDCDVALSPLGVEQSAALGHWLGSREPPPDVILSSPYWRALETAQLLREAAGWTSAAVIPDERLREREFGMLDRLTRTGTEQRYPEQAEMRSRLGKFYYRPPGGESWTDVILRLRSVIGTLVHDYRSARVFVVSHQVVVLCFRYLFEHLTEGEILAIDAAGEVANCSLTRYRYDPASDRHGGLSLVEYNVVDPLEEEGKLVTRSADAPVAPK